MQMRHPTPAALITIFTTALALMTTTGCKNNVQTKDAWQQVLEPCIRGGVMGNDVTFFGPSNNVGAGAVWRKRADGGYALVWSPSIQTPRLPANAINKNPNAACTGETDKSFTGSIGGSLVSSAVKGISADAKASLSRAKTVTVSAGAVRVEQLQEGPFHAFIQQNKNNPQAAWVQSVLQPDNLVSSVAYRVKGFKATLKFEGTAAADANAKLNTPTLRSSDADVGVNLKLDWKDNQTLEISSDQEFYVAAVLGRYNEMSGGTGMGEKLIKPVTVPSDKLSYEPAR